MRHQGKCTSHRCRWPPGRSCRLWRCHIRGSPHCHRFRHRPRLPGSLHCRPPRRPAAQCSRRRRRKCRQHLRPQCSLRHTHRWRLLRQRRGPRHHRCHRHRHRPCRIRRTRQWRRAGCRCSRSPRRECHHRRTPRIRRVGCHCNRNRHREWGCSHSRKWHLAHRKRRTHRFGRRIRHPPWPPGRNCMPWRRYSPEPRGFQRRSR